MRTNHRNIQEAFSTLLLTSLAVGVAASSVAEAVRPQGPVTRIDLGRIPADTIVTELRGKPVTFDAIATPDGYTSEGVDIGKGSGTLAFKFTPLKMTFKAAMGPVRGEAAYGTELPTNVAYRFQGEFAPELKNGKPFITNVKVLKIKD